MSMQEENLIIDAEYEEVPVPPVWRRRSVQGFVLAVLVTSGAIAGGVWFLTNRPDSAPRTQIAAATPLSAPATIPPAPAEPARASLPAFSGSGAASTAPSARPAPAAPLPPPPITQPAPALATPAKQRPASAPQIAPRANPRIIQANATTAAPAPPPAPAPAPAAAVGPKGFRDCEDCPELVAIAGGAFIMGSPPDEPGRSGDEGPQRRKEVGSFAVARHETTLREWKMFVEAAGRPDVHSNCLAVQGREWSRSGSWRNPGFAQTDDHPITCVSVEDARAYVAWLSRKTGHTYRLLTETEWEFVARANTRTPYWHGPSIAPGSAQFQGASARGTTAVGQFPPNAFGLSDTAGNVWEITDSCFSTDYDTAPPTREDGRCAYHAMRGGSWANGPASLRSAQRNGLAPTIRYNMVGFRVARVVSN